MWEGSSDPDSGGRHGTAPGRPRRQQWLPPTKTPRAVLCRRVWERACSRLRPRSKPAACNSRVAAKAAPTKTEPDPRPEPGRRFCGRGLLTPTATCIEGCVAQWPCRGQGRSHRGMRQTRGRSPGGGSVGGVLTPTATCIEGCVATPSRRGRGRSHNRRALPPHRPAPQHTEHLFDLRQQPGESLARRRRALADMAYRIVVQLGRAAGQHAGGEHQIRQ